MNKSLKANDDYEVRSNEVPKHRHKRLFMLHQNYISESEGALASTAANRQLDLIPTTRRQGNKSYALGNHQAQDKIITKPNFGQHKAITNRSRPMRTASQHMSFRQQYQSSYFRQFNNNNKSMGMAGELSSMVLSKGGQKMISGIEKYTSDSNSELFKLDIVDTTYKPCD